MRTCLAIIPAFVVTAAATASYPAPRAAESFYVIADAMQLKRVPAPAATDPKKQKTDDFLVVTQRDGKELQWGVNLFWLADQINSDCICTGTHEKEMTKYLSGIEDELRAADRNKQHPPRYVLRIVSERQGGPLFIAGVFRIQPQQDFERSSKFGSPMLQLTPEKVQELKTSDNYLRRLQEQSELNYAALQQRKD